MYKLNFFHPRLIFAFCFLLNICAPAGLYSQNKGTMKLKTITPNLMVDDVNKSVSFYCDVLGFTVIATVPDTGKFDFAMIGKDSVTMMFQTLTSFTEALPRFSGMKKGSGILLYFDVENLDEIYGKVKQSGAEIVVDLNTTFYGTREFTILDPDGYLVCFAEDVADR